MKFNTVTSSRRTFLGRAGWTGMASLAATSAWLPALPPLRADDIKPNQALVPLDSGIQPLVELIEQTPRQGLLAQIVQRIHSGLSYQELLAGLMLAGVRNIQPRPAVGFKFHSVLVVNSAHLASLASPDSDRWLPILWAVDYFKQTQREERQQSGWTMQPVDESAIPSPTLARPAFITAMDAWDVEAADVAVAGLVRSAGRNELFELFCRYGARDYRSIGHKAIYVANSFRTLDCIGWHHAEPIMRSLAYALLNHSGEPNPAQSDLPPDRAGRINVERLQLVPATWLSGSAEPTPELSTGRAISLTDALHHASAEDASREAIDLLRRGGSAQDVWDAVFYAAGELLMQQPGIIGLHSLTTANALRYAFNTSGVEETRRLLMLQACSFIPLFRASAAGRGNLASTRLDELLSSGDDEQPTADITPAEILKQVSHDRQQAAKSVSRYLRHGGSAEALMNEARRTVFAKGNDAHDYKFSSAVLEDYYQVSPPLRPMYLAASVFNLCGADDRDNQLITQLRETLS